MLQTTDFIQLFGNSFQYSAIIVQFHLQSSMKIIDFCLLQLNNIVRFTAFGKNGFDVGWDAIILNQQLPTHRITTTKMSIESNANCKWFIKYMDLPQLQCHQHV